MILIEFLISAAWVGILITGVASILHAEWNKTQCAYLAFQVAHAKLIDSADSPPKGVHIEEDGDSVEVEAHCGGVTERVRLLKLDSRGVFHLPMALATLLAVSVCLGVTGLLHHHHTLTADQLRIDECVGRTAVDLRKRLTEIYDLNDEIRALRISIKADPEPTSRSSLTSTLIERAAEQDLALTAWTLRKVQWFIERGCGGPDIPVAYPDLNFTRDPPDDAGPQPLRWNDHVREISLLVRLDRLPRKSAAEIKGDFYGESNWEIRWTRPENIPLQLAGADIH